MSRFSGSSRLNSQPSSFSIGAKFQLIAVTPKLFFKAFFSLELIDALQNLSSKSQILKDKCSY